MNTTREVSLILVVIVVGAAAFFFVRDLAKAPVSTIHRLPQTTEQSGAAFDGKNSTFTVNGSAVTLVHGVSKVPAAPGSATMVTTTYFGNEATGDMNGDGLPDTAFLVTQDGGGSGLFYYAVVALKTATGYKTTNAFLVGDRIAPQTTEINTSANELYINFAKRKPGEPMTVQPSQGATLYLKVTPAGVLEGLMK